jgi:hypothetical protein
MKTQKRAAQCPGLDTVGLAQWPFQPGRPKPMVQRTRWRSNRIHGRPRWRIHGKVFTYDVVEVRGADRARLVAQKLTREAYRRGGGSSARRRWRPDRWRLSSEQQRRQCGPIARGGVLESETPLN